MTRTTASRVVTSATLAACLLAGQSVYAINGINFYGLGARSRAMGGANCAAPVDTSTIYTNPAGLGHIGCTADFGAHVLLADRDIDRSSATGDFVNTDAGIEESRQPVYVTPFSGVSWCSSESPWAFGMVIAGTTGEGATYDQPRIDPDLLSGTYDTSSFVLCIKAIPAASYRVNDQLSIGAGLLVDVVLFSADLATSTLAQTAGRGRAEVSYLMGFQVGALYDINDCWAVGLAYTSRQWQLDDFSHYEDLIPGFELPPEIRCGVAYSPTDWLRLTADYKFINWENVGLFERLPTRGGFGWHNQHTVGLGMEAWLTPRLIGRLGWNYGKSPIDSDVVFANALVPAIYASHFGGGVEIKLHESHSLALSAIHTFRAQKSDDGSGDLFSQVGEGIGIDYRALDIDATWTIRF